MVKIIFTFFVSYSFLNLFGELRAASFALAYCDDARAALVTETNNLIVKEAEDVTLLTTKEVL